MTIYRCRRRDVSVGGAFVRDWRRLRLVRGAGGVLDDSRGDEFFRSTRAMLTFATTDPIAAGDWVVACYTAFTASLYQSGGDHSQIIGPRAGEFVVTGVSDIEWHWEPDARTLEDIGGYDPTRYFWVNRERGSGMLLDMLQAPDGEDYTHIRSRPWMTADWYGGGIYEAFVEALFDWDVNFPTHFEAVEIAFFGVVTEVQQAPRWAEVTALDAGVELGGPARGGPWFQAGATVGSIVRELLPATCFLDSGPDPAWLDIPVELPEAHRVQDGETVAECLDRLLWPRGLTMTFSRPDGAVLTPHPVLRVLPYDADGPFPGHAVSILDRAAWPDPYLGAAGAAAIPAADEAGAPRHLKWAPRSLAWNDAGTSFLLLKSSRVTAPGGAVPEPAAAAWPVDGETAAWAGQREVVNFRFGRQRVFVRRPPVDSWTRRQVEVTPDAAPTLEILAEGSARWTRYTGRDVVAEQIAISGGFALRVDVPETVQAAALRATFAGRIVVRLLELETQPFEVHTAASSSYRLAVMVAVLRPGWQRLVPVDGRGPLGALGGRVIFLTDTLETLDPAAFAGLETPDGFPGGFVTVGLELRRLARQTVTGVEWLTVTPPDGVARGSRLWFGEQFPAVVTETGARGVLTDVPTVGGTAVVMPEFEPTELECEGVDLGTDGRLSALTAYARRLDLQVSRFRFAAAPGVAPLPARLLLHPDTGHRPQWETLPAAPAPELAADGSLTLALPAGRRLASSGGFVRADEAQDGSPFRGFEILGSGVFAGWTSSPQAPTSGGITLPTTGLLFFVMPTGTVGLVASSIEAGEQAHVRYPQQGGRGVSLRRSATGDQLEVRARQGEIEIEVFRLAGVDLSGGQETQGSPTGWVVESPASIPESGWLVIGVAEQRTGDRTDFPRGIDLLPAADLRALAAGTVNQAPGESIVGGANGYTAVRYGRTAQNKLTVAAVGIGVNATVWTTSLDAASVAELVSIDLTFSARQFTAQTRYGAPRVVDTGTTDLGVSAGAARQAGAGQWRVTDTDTVQTGGFHFGLVVYRRQYRQTRRLERFLEFEATETEIRQHFQIQRRRRTVTDGTGSALTWQSTGVKMPSSGFLLLAWGRRAPVLVRSVDSMGAAGGQAVSLVDSGVQNANQERNRFAESSRTRSVRWRYRQIGTSTRTGYRDEVFGIRGGWTWGSWSQVTPAAVPDNPLGTVTSRSAWSEWSAPQFPAWDDLWVTTPLDSDPGTSRTSFPGAIALGAERVLVLLARDVDNNLLFCPTAAGAAQRLKIWHLDLESVPAVPDLAEGVSAAGWGPGPGPALLESGVSLTQLQALVAAGKATALLEADAPPAHAATFPDAGQVTEAPLHRIRVAVSPHDLSPVQLTYRPREPRGVFGRYRDVESAAAD